MKQQGLVANREDPVLRFQERIRAGINDFVHFFVIVPLFALANAGIPLAGASLVNRLFSPVALGIIIGLVLGKQLGITLFAFLTIKLGLADMPDGLSWKHIYGASWLGGVGFTMALFVASLAFRDTDLLAQAKLAILLASLFAGVGGFLVLYLGGRHSSATAA